MRIDSRSGSSGTGGFTLVELMVVMVLITIVTAFSLPAIRSSMFSDQLRGTARRLIGLVSEASQDAVGRQIPSQLNFDMEQNIVWMSDVSDNSDSTNAPPRYQVVLPDSVRVVDVDTAHGGKVGQGTAKLEFSKKGYVDRTFIHLRSDDGRDMTLMLSPFIAVTRVVDSYVELESETGRL